jgi:hypothetical protein
MGHHLIVTHKIMLCTGTVLQIGTMNVGGQGIILYPELPCIEAGTAVFM